MLKVELTPVKCEIQHCHAPVYWKCIVYSSALGDGLPGLYCLEHGKAAKEAIEGQSRVGARCRCPEGKHEGH